MQQGRWVSYIFRYRNNQRGENAGFIKVQRITSKYRVIQPRAGYQERQEDTARIQIGIKMFKEYACKCKVYLMYKPESMEEPSIKFLEEMHFKAEERDTIAKRFELDWDNPLGDEMAFDRFDGVYFVCDDGEVLAGMWNEYAFDPAKVRVEKTNDRVVYESAAAADEKTARTDKNVTRNKQQRENKTEKNYKEKDKPSLNEPAEKEEENISADNQKSNSEAADNSDGNICQYMLSTYPKLPVFSDSQLLECVKIVPHDIGKLAMSNWKLGINSFLSHGYYHYRYIMMGKVKFDHREVYVIGVPGVYTNKEKYLANMFGFNIFMPAKRTKLLTGNFGYWVSEISTE